MAVETRVITAAVLLPIAILAIWFLPVWILLILFIIIGMGAAIEWAELCDFSHSPYENPLTTSYSVFVFAVFIGIVVMWFLRAGAELYLFLAALSWVWLLIELIRGQRLIAAPLGAAIVGWIAIVGCAVAIFRLLEIGDVGRKLILALFFIVWSADIGAYYAGKFLGKHKLAPTVSPSKTIEGAIGGGVFALLTGIVAGALIWSEVSLWWVFIVTLTIVFSIVGDLIESREKRRVGSKDSGSLLPGHGGLLDRIDSLLAASPFFVLGLLAPVS